MEKLTGRNPMYYYCVRQCMLLLVHIIGHFCFQISLLVYLFLFSTYLVSCNLICLYLFNLFRVGAKSIEVSAANILNVV